MTTEKRREWSEKEMAAVWRELHIDPDWCGTRDVEAFTRLVLDARADLAEAQAELQDAQTELRHWRSQNNAIARARLEGAIEALEWAQGVHGSLDDSPYVNARLAELHAELEKLK